MMKKNYEFFVNGDVFGWQDGQTTTYVGHIDSDGDFRFSAEVQYDETRLGEIRRDLRDLIIATPEWQPTVEQEIFSRG